MPEYQVSIGMNKTKVPVGTIFLNSQWLNLKLFSLNNFNKTIEFTSINVIEPDVPDSKYPITVVLYDVLENQNNIELELKTKENDGYYYYNIIGILRDFTGIIKGRVGKLQVEIESMSISKIINGTSD